MTACKNCKHCKRHLWKQDECYHPSNMKVDPDTGKISPDFSIGVKRNPMCVDSCGCEGKQWEAQE